MLGGIYRSHGWALSDARPTRAFGARLTLVIALVRQRHSRSFIQITSCEAVSVDATFFAPAGLVLRSPRAGKSPSVSRSRHARSGPMVTAPTAC
jgi:hypothetical protein